MSRLELRVAPPIVMLVTAGLELVARRVDATPTLPVPARVAGAGVLLALGLAIFARAIATLHGAGTTANPHAPQRSSALVTSGIFTVSRNPMYLAMVVFLVAIAIGLGSPLALVPVAAFVAYIDRLQIRPEERALRAVFGDDFDAYCRRTRRWI